MQEKIRNVFAGIAGFITLILLMSVDSMSTKSLFILLCFAAAVFTYDSRRQARIRKSLTPLGDEIAVKYSHDLRETIRKIDEGR